MSGELTIMYGWLVQSVDQHTCGAGGSESSYMHEPTCGWNPLITVEDLTALLADASHLRAIERNAYAMAKDRDHPAYAAAANWILTGGAS